MRIPSCQAAAFPFPPVCSYSNTADFPKQQKRLLSFRQPCYHFRIMLILPIIAETDALENVDLAAATETYLLNNGMTPDNLTALKTKLSK